MVRNAVGTPSRPGPDGRASGNNKAVGAALGAAPVAFLVTVAAAFQPARRRIQAAVDRRFNRRRHDAGRIIDAFSARLPTRSTWTRSPPSC